MQIDSVRDHIKIVIANYEGNVLELEHAIGAAVLSSLFGWKAMHIFHCKKTIRSYQKILGYRFRDQVPEFGSLAYKSPALVQALESSDFWKAVSHASGFKIENRTRLDNWKPDENLA